MRLQELTGGILAGGKSSRMGQNKARLHLEGDGQSFLERIGAQMADCARILVSVNNREDYRDLPWELAVDELSGFGPVEGIYQLLQAAKTPYVLVAATDMPFLKRELFAALAARLPAAGAADALVLTRDGRPEPLCSIYGKGCLPALAQMRREQIHKIRFLYDLVPTVYVDLAALGLSEELIRNINTPEEYQAFS